MKGGITYANDIDLKTHISLFFTNATIEYLTHGGSGIIYKVTCTQESPFFSTRKKTNQPIQTLLMKIVFIDATTKKIMDESHTISVHTVPLQQMTNEVFRQQNIYNATLDAENEAVCPHLLFTKTYLYQKIHHSTDSDPFDNAIRDRISNISPQPKFVGVMLMENVEDFIMFNVVKYNNTVFVDHTPAYYALYE